MSIQRYSLADLVNNKLIRPFDGDLLDKARVLPGFITILPMMQHLFCQALFKVSSGLPVCEGYAGSDYLSISLQAYSFTERVWLPIPSTWRLEILSNYT
jgi:hypothetical protein